MYITPKTVTIDQDKFNSSVYIADYSGYELNLIMENASGFFREYLQQINKKHTYFPDEEELKERFIVLAFAKNNKTRFRSVCLIRSCKGNLYLFDKRFLKFITGKSSVIGWLYD